MSQHKRSKSQQVQAQSSDNSETKSAVTGRTTRRRASWVVEIGGLVAAAGIVVGLIVLLSERTTDPLTPVSVTSGSPADATSAPGSLGGGLAGSPEHWQVPDPDTTEMQAEVRERILAARADVLARPRDPEAWGNLGAVLDATEIYDAAEVCYRRARSLEPSQFLYSYLLAIVLDAQGRGAEEVVTLYRQAAELGPRYAPAFWRLGDALVRQRQFEAARDAFQTAVAIDPELAMGYRGLGQALLALGDHDSAITHLERAAELTPDDGGIYEALVHGYTAIGEHERAAEADQNARSHPHQRGVPDPAVDQLRGLSVDSPIAYQRAYEFVAAGDYRAAIPDLLIVEKARTDDALVRVLLAEAYRRTGELEEADLRLSDALGLKPDTVSAYVELARLRTAQGKPEEAIEIYQQADDLAPDHPTINIELGLAAMRTGQHDVAISAFECASGKREINANVHVQWGYALRQGGAIRESIEHFRQAIQLAPKYADAHAQLGVALAEAGNGEEAAFHIRRAAELNPDHPIARRRNRSAP